MRLWATCLFISLVLVNAMHAQSTNPHFGIHVVDEATGRGVPLIELRTVNDIAFWTDSAGWIAFHEPELMNREVYFAVRGPGYEYPKDGFGFRGVRLETKAGGRATVKVKRTQVAERLYRLTGQGRYRDSMLLGQPTLSTEAMLPGGVLGQDSVQMVPYRGKLFWLWGDTNFAHYPLGNFQTTSATSPLPGTKGGNPEEGIALNYYTDPAHPDRSRRMVPVNAPGPVWLFGLLTVKDDDGQEALLAHYSRRKSLAEEAEHGMVRFDDEKGIFRITQTLDLKENWRFPRGNAFRVHEADGDYFYFASPLPHTRVKAEWKQVIAPEAFEAFTWYGQKQEYVWQRQKPPTTQSEERDAIRAGTIPEEKGRFRLVDSASGRAVQIHTSSVAWNAYRRRWIMLGVQEGNKEALSYLGEVWYAEADHPTGPWRKAVQIASHPRYSFYNVRHHAMFDAADGKVIYFEGTYTHTFSGNPVPTPRYDYNQILYRLDLSDDRLMNDKSNRDRLPSKN